MARKCTPEIKIMSRRDFAKAIGKRPNGDFYTKKLPEIAKSGAVDIMREGKDVFVRLRDGYEDLEGAEVAYSIRRASRMSSLPEERLRIGCRKGTIPSVVKEGLKNPQRFLRVPTLQKVVADAETK